MSVAQANPLFELEAYTSNSLRSEVAQLTLTLNHERETRRCLNKELRNTSDLLEATMNALDRQAADMHRLHLHLALWRVMAFLTAFALLAAVLAFRLA